MREEERQLIRELVAGNPAAEDEFVSLWYPRIVAWIRQCALNLYVDDYAQEVWWHLIKDDCRRLLQWQGLYDDAAWHGNSLSAFLKKLTINKVIDLQQAERRHLRTRWHPLDIVDEFGPAGMDPAMEAERDRLAVALEHCMSHFKAKDHKLVEMWWEGHADRHIAVELASTVNNVYQRRYYLFNQLRDCLREKLPEYFGHA